MKIKHELGSQPNEQLPETSDQTSYFSLNETVIQSGKKSPLKRSFFALTIASTAIISACGGGNADEDFPSSDPSPSPTISPSIVPTAEPSTPTPTPVVSPPPATLVPTVEPSPTFEPTLEPSVEPTPTPTLSQLQSQLQSLRVNPIQRPAMEIWFVPWVCT